MEWFRMSQDTRLPDWLKKNLNETCPICGSEIENGYNKNGECTRRRCTNDECLAMIAERIGKMCDLLGIKGIKSGIGLQYAKTHNMKSHFEAVPLIVRDGKPRITLSMLLRCCFLYGIDAECDAIASHYSSVSEMLNEYNGKHKQLLLENHSKLLEAEKYFDIIKIERQEKKFDSVVFGDIVITGEIPGFANRDTFVPLVNKFYRGLVEFGYSRSRRKTGLYCCIAQDKSATTGKVQDAKEGGFPIYTVEEFFRSVNKRIVDAGYGDCLREIGKKKED